MINPKVCSIKAIPYHNGTCCICVDLYFYSPFQGGVSFVDRYVISGLFLLCFRARLFIDVLLSTAGKGLTSWLSFVKSNCEIVTFP